MSRGISLLLQTVFCSLETDNLPTPLGRASSPVHIFGCAATAPGSQPAGRFLRVALLARGQSPFCCLLFLCGARHSKEVYLYIMHTFRFAGQEPGHKRNFVMPPTFCPKIKQP